MAPLLRRAAIISSAGLLWPPCIADADIMFYRCGFFFLLLFFSCVFSAVTDWMSTILPHMMWLYCAFRMQVWNVLHAARWKYRTQKIAICAPLHNFVGPVSLQLRHVLTIGKSKLNSNISSTCPRNMVNFSIGNGWDWLVSLGHPSKFQQVSRLGCVIFAI